MVVISTSAGWNFNMGIESSFNSGSGTLIGHPGVGAKITTLSIKNNPELVYMIGSRRPAAVYSKGVDVDFTIDFIFANDNIQWIQYILSGTTAPYTPQLTIQSGYVLIQTPEGNMWTVSGIVFDNVKFSVSAGGEVKVTLTGKGSKFLSSATTIPTPTVPTQIVTWDKCSLSLGGGQPIQSMDLTINTGAELFRTLNNLYYVAYLPEKFSVDFSAEIMHDSGIVETLMAATNPLSSTSISATIGSHSITLTAYPEEGGVTVEPVNPVIDKISYKGSNISFS